MNAREHAAPEASIPSPEYSVWEVAGAAMAVARRALDEVRALAREPGPQGKEGPAGKPGAAGMDGADGRPGEDGRDGRDGRLESVKMWAEGVHYEREVVSHAGGTWQAIRDTGREPPHTDWQCIAAPGRDGADGRSFVIRGTYEEAARYQALDVVTLNGGSFAARKDAPGPCPGEGWQLIASQGKQGKPGNTGPALKGDPGRPGPPVMAMSVDDQGMLTLTNADGSEVTCDLYPLLSKLDRRS